jgi:hypothetical protein
MEFDWSVDGDDPEFVRETNTRTPDHTDTRYRKPTADETPIKVYRPMSANSSSYCRELVFTPTMRRGNRWQYSYCDFPFKTSVEYLNDTAVTLAADLHGAVPLTYYRRNIYGYGRYRAMRCTRYTDVPTTQWLPYGDVRTFYFGYDAEMAIDRADTHLRQLRRDDRDKLYAYLATIPADSTINAWQVDHELQRLNGYPLTDIEF